MPLDDQVHTVAPPAGPAAGAPPQKGKTKPTKNAGKDEILINPDEKQIVQEAKDSHVVMAYGRMNPPTTGHAALVNKMHDVAKEHSAHHVLIASHTQDAKKNPLSGEDKVKHLKRYFPKTNIALADKEHPTFLQHAAKLNKEGHTHLHMIAGSDRVDEYKHKLNQYNGKGEGKLFNFKHIEVHSSGERDPDAEGVSGMSASKMREHAKSGNYKEFKKGVPSHVSDTHAKELYKDTRKGMNINEDFDLDLLERVVNLQQRRARGILMKRMASRLTRARNISRTRPASPKQLERRAYKQAKQNIRRRFAGMRGMEYQTLGPSGKVSVDVQIDPKVKNIKSFVKRIMPRIKQADVRRLQAVRSHKKYHAGGAVLQANSTELDFDKFNRLYEMTFNEAKKNDSLIGGRYTPAEHDANVEKLKSFVKKVEGKKPKTVYDDKTRKYKVVYEEVQPTNTKVNLNENFGAFMLAKDFGIVAEGGFAMHPSAQILLDEDAADHLRQAQIADRSGKPHVAAQHRKIANALTRGDVTTAKGLKAELKTLK